MLNNYHYFLTLSEELNISRAASKLYVSHQNLSNYLRKLENYYGVTLFVRKPQLTLTSAGKALYEFFRGIEQAEKNLQYRMGELKDQEVGIVNFGITKGRYRILAPELLKRYKEIYPHVQLNIINDTSTVMREKLLQNQLDLFLSGTMNMNKDGLKLITVLEEQNYLVISDNMLKVYFGDAYPACKEEFTQGVDLGLFQKVPFILNTRELHSRLALDAHLETLGISLNVVLELTEPDMHHKLSDVDYAASFCLSMYRQEVEQLNLLNTSGSKLNLFSVKGLTQTNNVSVIFAKDAHFPRYIKDLIQLIKELCQQYSQ